MCRGSSAITDYGTPTFRQGHLALSSPKCGRASASTQHSTTVLLIFHTWPSTYRFLLRTESRCSGRCRWGYASSTSQPSFPRSSGSLAPARGMVSIQPHPHQASQKQQMNLAVSKGGLSLSCLLFPTKPASGRTTEFSVGCCQAGLFSIAAQRTPYLKRQPCPLRAVECSASHYIYACMLDCAVSLRKTHSATVNPHCDHGNGGGNYIAASNLKYQWMRRAATWSKNL